MTFTSSLTICSVVFNDKQTELFDLMVRSAIKFTSNEPRFIILDNGGNNLDKYKSLSNFTIVKNDRTGFSGSLQHGESLNKIFPMVTTHRTAIIEPDCILLRYDWDLINFPHNKMVAAKKGELAGQPFYHICFMVFGTKLLKYNGIIDFRPGQDGKRSSRSYKMSEDVGHQIRKKVRPDEINYMEFIDCKSGNGAYFDKTFQSDEFWLDGQPTVAHFGRGANISGKKIRKGFKHPKEQLERWKTIANEIIKK